MMRKVIIASNNPAKINAVQQAFTQVFTHEDMVFEGIAVDSGVAAQPLSGEETLTGARNRVTNARRQQPDADFWVGLEAGIESPLTFAWMVIESTDQRGEARSASLPLPPEALQRIDDGAELGEAMDAMFNERNIKQKGGAIGLLTGHRLTRSSVYVQALILALIPFIHPALYPARA
ncbi:inosine/xanthosine triphosphatase [Kistimonas scapharcae]|uniref:Inosine/xanthosine triphosphatase n=1 Tax=Kistimonas scapharcae TaxID=1036133 RepID=A0ABP8VA34_9GAMM